MIKEVCSLKYWALPRSWEGYHLVQVHVDFGRGNWGNIQDFPASMICGPNLLYKETEISADWLKVGSNFSSKWDFHLFKLSRILQGISLAWHSEYSKILPCKYLGYGRLPIVICHKTGYFSSVNYSKWNLISVYLTSIFCKVENTKIVFWN